MATIIPFIKKDKTTDEFFHDVLNAFKDHKLSSVLVCFEHNKENIDDVKKINIEIISQPIQFFLLNEFRKLYLNKLSLNKINELIEQIKIKNSFSNNICDKVFDFIKTGKPYFKREAQFPPDIIRRTEKNLYFATSFLMAVTKLFVECHKLVFVDKNVEYNFVIIKSQNIDRCSLRFLQNFLLYFKNYSVKFSIVFDQKKEIEISKNKQKFIKSRLNCFRKFLYVALSSGCTPSNLDVENFLNKVDFNDAFNSFLEESKRENKLTDIDDFRNLLYRSRYEDYYIAEYLHQQKPWLTKNEQKKLVKLGVLCDAYNYFFDDAIKRLDDLVTNIDSQDLCYLHLLKGLIQFKKLKSANEAILTINKGSKIAKSIDDRFDRTIELAFLGNAINLIKTVNIITTKSKKEQNNYLGEILNNEHEILQSICNAFISCSDDDLNGDNIFNILFILTTIVENISTLNKLSGLDYGNIDLYLSYEHIFKVVANRIQKEKYKTSFIISYSHALIPIKLRIANGYFNINEYKKAYEITKELILEIDKYDVTGDYRAYLFNAHAVYSAKIGLFSEANKFLAKVCAICLDYNDPHMMRIAMSHSASYLKEIEPDTYYKLQQSGIINEKFNFPDPEIRFMNAAVDLENNLTVGIAQLMFTKTSLEELKTYDKPDKKLHAIFKQYGYWKQIAYID